MNRHSTPLFLVTSPPDWPEGWASLFKCSIFAAFLTDPFVSLLTIAKKLGGSAAEDLFDRRFVHACMRACVRACVHACVRACTRTAGACLPYSLALLRL